MSEERVGTVTHYFDKVHVAIIKADAPIEVGDTLHVKGPTDDFTFDVNSMQIDHEDVETAAPGQEVGIKVPERAHESSDVFRVDA